MCDKEDMTTTMRNTQFFEKETLSSEKFFAGLGQLTDWLLTKQKHSLSCGFGTVPDSEKGSVDVNKRFLILLSCENMSIIITHKPIGIGVGQCEKVSVIVFTFSTNLKRLLRHANFILVQSIALETRFGRSVKYYLFTSTIILPNLSSSLVTWGFPLSPKPAVCDGTISSETPSHSKKVECAIRQARRQNVTQNYTICCTLESSITGLGQIQIYSNLTQLIKLFRDLRVALIT